MVARRRPSPDDAHPEEVGELVAEMMSHVYRRFAGETLAIMTEAGLTMAQMVAMHVLIQCGSRTVSAVAEALHLSPAATSHLIDRLVRQGLVEREEDPADRRQKRVSMSAKGRQLIERLNRERTREMSAAIADLSSAVKAQFSKVLVKVIAELSGLPKAAAPPAGTRPAAAAGAAGAAATAGAPAAAGKGTGTPS